MKLLRWTFVMSVLALAFGAKTLYGTGPPTIWVINNSTIPTSVVADALPAFQAAIDEDFGPTWAAFGQLKIANGFHPGGWQIELKDYVDCWGCAGFHQVRDHAPYGQVGMLGAHYSWQLVFTHELFEMLGDPWTDRAQFIRRAPYCNFGHCNATSDSFWAVEVADPVEYIHWSYNRPSASGKNVVISDFVTPDWFRCQGGKLDFVGHVHHCRTILYGGYLYVFKNNEWFDISEEHRYEFRR